MKNASSHLRFLSLIFAGVVLHASAEADYDESELTFRPVSVLPEIDFESDPRTGRRAYVDPEEVLKEQLEILSNDGQPLPEKHVEFASRMGITSRAKFHKESFEMDTTARQTVYTAQGSKSTIKVLHQDLDNPSAEEQSNYLKAQEAFNAAADVWSNNFPSSVEIRVRSTWLPNSNPRNLGSAYAYRVWQGDDCRSSQGDSSGPGVFHSIYPAAVLNSILGVDYGNPTYHVSMNMNSNYCCWHFDYPDPVPSDKSDLMSVALHEIGHGLYMSSRATDVNSATENALFSESGSSGTYETSIRVPGRFDDFITDDNRISLKAYCPSTSQFYKLIVGDNTGGSSLRFYDPDAPVKTDFHLNTPSSYQPGSSVSHFHEDESGPDNAATLKADCTAAGIPLASCSELMTPSLTRGTMSRSVGENDRRVLDSIMSSRSGFNGEKCSFDPWNVPS